MTRIVELCVAANELEARALCAVLEGAGIHAETVGESIGNAAGLGPMGTAAAPRVWVDERDVPRAQEIVEGWRREVIEEWQCLTDADADEDDEGDETGRVTDGITSVGTWLLGGFSCVVFGGMFCVILAEAIRRWSSDPLYTLMAATYGLVLTGGVAVVSWLLIRKTMRGNCPTACPEDSEAVDEDVAVRNPFRFSPELYDVRNSVASELHERGLDWLTHYLAIDVMHDVHGIEVCGIEREDDATRILGVLKEMSPSWKIHRSYYKDCGRDLGFVVTIQRDPESPDQPWESEP